MKFTSLFVAILSATAVNAYEHNGKSMLRGVDTKVHNEVPPPSPAVCRNDSDCPVTLPQCNNGEDGKPDSDCSQWKSQGKSKCCVSPEEDSLSKKAEAMEKVAKVLPMLKDAAMVQSDAVVKDEIPICDCTTATPACGKGFQCVGVNDYCEPTCSAITTTPATGAQDPCDAVCADVSCNGNKVCCANSDCSGYSCVNANQCSREDEAVFGGAKVQSDAVVKEDEKGEPICGCEDPYACPADSTCEDWGDCQFGCIPSPDPAPEPATTTIATKPATEATATAAQACNGEDPCATKNCPNNKPNCVTDWDTCRASCTQ